VALWLAASKATNRRAKSLIGADAVSIIRSIAYQVDSRIAICARLHQLCADAFDVIAEGKADRANQLVAARDDEVRFPLPLPFRQYCRSTNNYRVWKGAII
jgi:hypothetical protein